MSQTLSNLYISISFNVPQTLKVGVTTPVLWMGKRRLAEVIPLAQGQAGVAHGVGIPAHISVSGKPVLTTLQI